MLDTTLSPRAVPAGAGSTYRVVDDLVTFKATGATTNGAYALFETHTPPGKGVPPHHQRYEDEAFWVLEGSYRFVLGERQLELGPGGFVFVPRGTLHAFANSGDAPARMLILVSPGGIHERFFAEVGQLVEDPQAPPAADVPDLARLVSVAARYGIEILPQGA